ncbi:MAG: hypothetical protein JXQ83_05630 [Candidatus Glassbacteria bacterium]|nr:hypothetical protein [Candidatus Glassbacteria bacterium]
MKRGILAVAAVFISWALLDFVIHWLILGCTYAATAQLWRPMEEMKMGLMYFNSLVVAIIFVYLYARYIAGKGVCTGVAYGLLMGIMWGISMGYGTYSVMPIPYYMALVWFLGTVVEMTLAGLWVGLIIREPAGESA